MVDIQRGKGPDALPYGAATRLNEERLPSPPGPDMSSLGTGAPGADVPVQYIDKPPDVDMRPTGRDSLDLLTGPADPDYMPTPQYSSHVSRRLARALPVIFMGARDPQGPRSLKALYRAVVAKLEQEHYDELN